MALTDKLSAIADAIREKTGESGTMTLAEMPDKIAGISGGGIEADGVNIDEDGYIRIYSLPSFGTATLPVGVFRWNYVRGVAVSMASWAKNALKSDQSTSEFHLKFSNGYINNFNALAQTGNGMKNGALIFYFEGNRPKPTRIDGAFTWGYGTKRLYGEIDMTDCTTAGQFINGSDLAHIEFCPNTMKISMGAKSTSLDLESAISMCNAIKEGITGQTVSIPTKFQSQTIKGSINNSFVDVNGNTCSLFIPSDDGAVTLADFVTNTKGWSLAYL